MGMFREGENGNDDDIDATAAIRMKNKRIDDTSDNVVVDSDELLEQLEQHAVAHLSLSTDAAALQKRRQRKQWLEEVAVCERIMLQESNTSNDSNNSSGDNQQHRQRTVLCYAAALEGLGRRQDAIDSLRSCLLRACSACSMNSSTSSSTDILYDEDFEEPKGDSTEEEQQEDPLLALLYETKEQQQADNTDSTTVAANNTVWLLPVTLALAKLYFKHGLKASALKWCDLLCSQITIATATRAEQDDASDAFHLAGWIRIHKDDHTGAYQMWTQGHAILPHCASLERQYNKRACWDSNDNAYASTNEQRQGEESNNCSRERTSTSEMVGNGAVPQSLNDLEGFTVPLSLRTKTPALALFDPECQQNQLVFRSREPVLTQSECARVLDHVHEYIDTECNGTWNTVRQSSVTTTDVAVEDIAVLRPWLRELLQSRLYPLVNVAYPKLADGSSTVVVDADADDVDAGETTTGRACSPRMRVHDAFIVRYDAECDGSISLPEHSDTSAVSFTVALNDQNGSFEGGGTWFEALDQDGGMVVDADVGHAVAFAGPLRHAGYPVTKGVRIILVLFLYVEGFPYGRYVDEYTERHGISCIKDDNKDEGGNETLSDEDARRPSGDMPGGYVVYNQTVQLTALLNRRVESVLE